MCGIRNQEVVEILDAHERFEKEDSVERFRHIVGAVSLFSRSEGYDNVFRLAKEFYEAALSMKSWEDVQCLVEHYCRISKETVNDSLRLLVLGLLDVLEDEREEMKRQTSVEKMISEAMEVKLNFSSSKGKGLREVYVQAGSKEQFEVILNFLIDHPRCDDKLRKAALLLVERLEMIP